MYLVTPGAHAMPRRTETGRCRRVIITTFQDGELYYKLVSFVILLNRWPQLASRHIAVFLWLYFIDLLLSLFR